MKLNPAGPSLCYRPERDERGRLLPGSTANPRGRPRTAASAKLFAAAELGAVVVLMPKAQPTVADEVAAPPTEAA